MNTRGIARLGWALSVAAAVGLAAIGCGGGNKDTSSPKKPEQGAVSWKSGKLSDGRDGQKYRTVEMPDGKTWMAENLRFKIGDSWCYENNEDNCAKYGRLYDWNMAKMACPKGWVLPSRDEWTELVTVVGSETSGKKLKSTSGWNKNGNGTDEFGFSALPGGYRISDGGFGRVGERGIWWTATEDGESHAYYRYMGYDSDYVDENDFNYKSSGFSVRCVQYSK